MLTASQLALDWVTTFIPLDLAAIFSVPSMHIMFLTFLKPLKSFGPLTISFLCECRLLILWKLYKTKLIRTTANWTKCFVPGSAKRDLGILTVPAWLNHHSLLWCAMATLESDISKVWWELWFSAAQAWTIQGWSWFRVCGSFIHKMTIYTLKLRLLLAHVLWLTVSAVDRTSCVKPLNIIRLVA